MLFGDCAGTGRWFTTSPFLIPNFIGCNLGYVVVASELFVIAFLTPLLDGRPAFQKPSLNGNRRGLAIRRWRLPRPHGDRRRLGVRPGPVLLRFAAGILRSCARAPRLRARLPPHPRAFYRLSELAIVSMH